MANKKKKNAKKQTTGKKLAGKKDAKKSAKKDAKKSAKKDAGKKAIKAQKAGKESRKAAKKVARRDRYPNRVTVICTYRVKESTQPDFHALMTRHWPTLKKLGLATSERPLLYTGKDESGQPLLVEIFSWIDPQAPERAHADPEVMAIWNAMEPFLEERSGHRKWEFVHVAPAPIRLAKL